MVKSDPGIMSGFIGGLLGFPLAFFIYMILDFGFFKGGHISEQENIFLVITSYIFAGLFIQLWTFRGYKNTDKVKWLFWYWVLFVVGSSLPIFIIIKLIMSPLPIF